MFKIGLFKEPESLFRSLPFGSPPPTPSSEVGPGTGKVRPLPSEVSAESLEQIAGSLGGAHTLGLQRTKTKQAA